MAKLSPKDFYSITYWMKQFINDSSEPKYSINIIQHINATITCDKTMAEEGETITCTITPNEGYQVDKFLVNGVESELTFTMPAEDITISAEVSYIIYGTLNAPTLEIISNDSTQLIYNIKNSNNIDCLFNGETVSGSGALELTHIWEESEESFLIEGYFSADHYFNSEEMIETVDKYIPVEMPVKGDIITMDIRDGSQSFLVLDINDNIAHVMAKNVATIDGEMITGKTESTDLWITDSIYTKLNNEWYETLNNKAKNAIVEHEIMGRGWMSTGIGNYNWSITSIGTYTSTDSYGSNYTKTTGKVYIPTWYDLMKFKETPGWWGGNINYLGNLSTITYLLPSDGLKSGKILIGTNYRSNSSSTGKYIFYFTSSDFDHDSYISGYLTPVFYIDLTKIKFSK